MAKYYTRPPSKPTKPLGKPLDVLAGQPSAAGILKKQRQAMESGDETSMHPVAGLNSSDEVLKRGYFTEKE